MFVCWVLASTRSGTRDRAGRIDLIPAVRPELQVFSLQLVHRHLHMRKLLGLNIGELFEVGHVGGCLAVSHSTIAFAGHNKLTALFWSFDLARNAR